LDWTYGHLASDGDMISEHLEEGVPWPEMLAGDDFTGTYLANLQDRKNRLVPGWKVLVQINALNTARDGLALYRSDNINDPLPSPFDTAAFNDTSVKTAYLNYARKMADFFDPDWLMIGVESNLLIRNAAADWPAYLELLQYVRAGLAASHPGLKVGLSVFCVPYFPATSSVDDVPGLYDMQIAALADLDATFDFIAFSVHPFISALLADSFPEDYLDQLFALTTKPVAVSESSYPAQEWSTSGLTWYGTPEKQDTFTRLLLEKAQQHGAQFVVWFTVRDYDQLWAGALGMDPTALVWRDTGFYDETGSRRIGGDRWRQVLSNPLSP